MVRRVDVGATMTADGQGGHVGGLALVHIHHDPG
jgi:hypothetical protein